MQTTKTYVIQYYGSDGSGELGALEGNFSTMAEARAEINRRVGNHGKWPGVGDNDPDGWATVEAWHESADECCGGYGILESAN